LTVLGGARLTMISASSPDATEAILATIAKKVERGECILFLGAGAHCAPPKDSPYAYPEGHRPLSTPEFSKRLASGCGFADSSPGASPTSLQRISLQYEIAHSRRALVEEIIEAVDTEKQPSPALAALARLNFPLVITTNYDQLFERALRDAKKRPIVSVYEPELKSASDTREDPTADRPLIFKIHGDIDRSASIVITDEDYIQFILRMSHSGDYSPIPFLLKFYFTRWPTLFIGYSLLDYNLRLLFKTLRWTVDRSIFPDTYSVDLAPDPLIFEVWEHQRRYVRFISQDIWHFVPRLYRMVTGEEMPSDFD
jgi:hypothetical protein